MSKTAKSSVDGQFPDRGNDMRVWNALLAGVALACVALSGCETSATAPGAQNGQTRSLHVVASYPAPDGGWDLSAIDAARRRLYLSRSNGVTVLDLATGTVTPLLVAGTRTHIALPVNDGADILVTNGGSGGVFIADAMSGAIRFPTIATGAKPDAAFLEPTTGLAWVMDNGGAGIALIDTRAGRVAGHIDVAGAIEAPVSDGRGVVYVTLEDRGEIVAIDARTRAITAHYPLADCTEPGGLAYDAADRRLIAECANGKAKIISAADGHVLASLPIGPRPDGLILDPTRNLVFAPTGGDAMMSVIDPTRMAIVSVIPTRAGARNGAIDPNTGDIYLASGAFTPPVPPATRPTLVPGSVQILKLAS
jgi:DNA-binding beta-propeller fold protein YncE